MHPILFKFGPVTIYSYGFFVASAFLITGYLIVKDSPNYGISKEGAWNLLLCLLISGLVGARFLHVLLNIKYYIKEPVETIMLHRGGLAIHGAIIGAVSVSIFFLVKKKLPIWKAGDLIMQYLPLGQAVGRIGCFFNGCCYGKGGHPTQLYSAFGLLGIYAILRLISRKERRFHGEIFSIYFIIYPPFRFFMDFLRADLKAVLFGLTASQLISVALFAAGVIIYLIRYNIAYGKDKIKSRKE